jgi:hypothetical protein
MSSQTYFLSGGFNVPAHTNDQAGTLLFDSTAGDYPPAVAMRFQIATGLTEDCYVHIEGFHNKNDSTDPAYWDKAIVAPNQPLEILFRNPSRLTEGYITKVYGWSAEGGGCLNWTPIARF